jgi:hypothetical protein
LDWRQREYKYEPCDDDGRAWFFKLLMCPLCGEDEEPYYGCGVIVHPDGRLAVRCVHDSTVGWAEYRDHLRWDETIDKVLETIGGAAPGIYRLSPRGLFRMSGKTDAVERVQLTNFGARIVSNIVHDDGAERRSVLEIEAELDGYVTRVQVPAEEFPAMNWVIPRLGPRAVVCAGQGVKDHARAAIQSAPGDVVTEVVYTHTGWREHGGRWVYLHAGGAVGAGGPVSDVRVELSGPLAHYLLPEPPSGEALREAVRASLGLTRAAPPELTLPLLAAVYRATLGSTDFSLHLCGPTGQGKTALAALAQQHFGAGLDAGHTPANWSSTANANEGLAFLAKDALLLVDDFAPGSTLQDAHRLQRDADRLIRNQGNGAGRGRMRPDGSLRPARAPRGTILSTGEDVPRGQSVRARLLVLEVSPGMVAWDELTRLQADAARGLFAAGMAGYLRWLAGRYEEVRRESARRVQELRARAAGSTQHKRTPGIVGDLQVGVELFARFAREAGAVSDEEARALCDASWEALGRAAAHQAYLQAASEPAQRFVDLLGAAIVAGKAHVASLSGRHPEFPAGWGWRKTDESGWAARGDRVGWLDQDTVYLEPDAAFAAAQRLAGDGGEPLAVTLTILQKRLHERGMLAAVDVARDRLTLRKTVERKQRKVLCLRASLLGHPEATAPAEPDDEPAWGRAAAT